MAPATLLIPTVDKSPEVKFTEITSDCSTILVPHPKLKSSPEITCPFKISSLAVREIPTAKVWQVERPMLRPTQPSFTVKKIGADHLMRVSFDVASLLMRMPVPEAQPPRRHPVFEMV